MSFRLYFCVSSCWINSMTSPRSFRLHAEGCWAAARPCWGASDVFNSEDTEGGEAKCAQALFPGRVQHEERLPGQDHLCPVRRGFDQQITRQLVRLGAGRTGACFCSVYKDSVVIKHSNVKPSCLFAYSTQRGRYVCLSLLISYKLSIFWSNCVLFFPTDYLSGWLHSSTTAYVLTNPLGATS